MHSDIEDDIEHAVRRRAADAPDAPEARNAVHVPQAASDRDSPSVDVVPASMLHTLRRLFGAAPPPPPRHSPASPASCSSPCTDGRSAPSPVVLDREAETLARLMRALDAAVRTRRPEYVLNMTDATWRIFGVDIVPLGITLYEFDCAFAADGAAMEDGPMHATVVDMALRTDALPDATREEACRLALAVPAQNTHPAYTIEHAASVRLVTAGAVRFILPSVPLPRDQTPWLLLTAEQHHIMCTEVVARGDATAGDAGDARVCAREAVYGNYHIAWWNRTCNVACFTESITAPCCIDM